MMRELLYLFIKVVLLAIFMTSLTPLKNNDKKSYSIIVVGNIIIWLSNFLIYVLVDVSFLERVIFLSTVLPAFIFFSVIAKYPGFKVLFTLLTVSLFGMMCGFVSVLATLMFNNDGIGALFNVLCYILIIVFIMKVFRKPYYRMLETLETGWGLFCSVPFILMVIIFLLQYHPVSIENRPENISLLFLVYILVFAFYTIVYLNFENISQYYQLKQDKRLMLLQTEMQKKEYAAILDKINAIQIYRHDIRHHINAINALVDENNLVEAKKYLGKLDDRLTSTVIEKYCENYVVNVILSSYINRAREENIEVTCEAEVPANLKIEELEVGTIFSNAIENAITACGQIADHDNRKISIVCREHFGQLNIQICNTFTGKVVFDGEYPVTDQENHGIGTRSIAAIAEKYSGIFSFSVEDGLFVTTVILNAAC
jgi:Signal transduction histidine kinase regulating citrate/malate metabolism